jgi:hypothetical protein
MTKPTAVTESIRGRDYTAVVVLEDEGTPREVGRWQKRTVKIGRVFRVELDGNVIGRVHYDMLTRERRTPGKRYVNARWQSPGWTYVSGAAKFGRKFECYSKREGVERIIRDAVAATDRSE